MGEDPGAEPVFGINCGRSLNGHVVPMSRIGQWVQAALDAIQYANGLTNTVWGAMREVELASIFVEKAAMLGYIKPMNDITLVLDAINRGETQAAEQLLPLVYGELRKLAAARMAQEAAGHTLQPTALVHEAWLQLVGDGRQNWNNRAYFFAAAAEAMRRILVEHARRKARLKRGGGRQRLNIEDVELANTAPDDRVLLVDEALEELERSNPERARVVVMKFFGGMTNKEVAETLGIGERSVERHWMFARAWLFQKIRERV